MTVDRAIYARARAQGLPAKYAAQIARPVEPPIPGFDISGPGEVFEFEQDGFDIRVQTQYDEGLSDEDIGYGRFVFADRYNEDKRPDPEAIPVRYNQHTEAKWYVPQSPLREVWEYEHKAGASKSVALDLARARQEAELQSCLADGYGPDVRVVTVTVSKAGVELAEESVGGVEIGWDPITQTDGSRYLAEVARDILPEALEQAREALPKIIDKLQEGV